jgi:2-dehydro-3-deoxygluconokinase
MALDIKPAEACRWDAISLGEVMLRFDPGWGRVRTTRAFRVSEGGGEYNVTRALRKVFGLRTAVVTALVDSEIGHLVEDCMLQGGVDLRYVKWVPHDGIGLDARVGVNFVEKGFGIRPALGVSDRAHTAVSKLKPGDIDWSGIFGDAGVRWMHTGGIFAALSDSTAEVALEAMQAARAAGTIVSYDLNYRPSLWKPRGGQERAIEVNRELARYVDVMIGNEEDFTSALGFEVPELDHEISKIDPAAFKAMIGQVTEAFPNLAVVATTLRNAKTASVNDWGAVLWTGGRFYEARMREDLDIYDRVGGGDGFATGMAWGFLDGRGPQEAVEIGAAHGALTMTTPGDTSMMTKAEVLHAVAAKGARVVR